MNYQIKLHKKARKFLENRVKKDRDKIIDKISELQNNPTDNQELDISKMIGFEQRYRLRVNNYRIIYEVFHEEIYIYLLDIGNRGDIYK